MCPRSVCPFSLTLLGNLGQLLDLGHLPLTFLGLKMVGPRTPLVLVRRIPRPLRDTIVVLDPIGDEKNVPGQSHQCIKVKLRKCISVEKAHLASEETSAQNRPYGSTVRIVFVKGTARDENTIHQCQSKPEDITERDP